LLQDKQAGGQSFIELLNHLDSCGLGCAMFIFNIPRSPDAHIFPQPVLPPGDGFEFFDWSTAPEILVPPKKFTPAYHMYMSHSEHLLLFAVQGPRDQLYAWAQDWLNYVSKSSQYKQWTQGAVWLTTDDVRKLEIGELIHKPSDNIPSFNESYVDLDAPDVLNQIYKPTAQEVDAIRSGEMWGHKDDPSGAEEILQSELFTKKFPT
jgi:hypothetical protein